MLLWWIFSALVLPIMRTFFYATDAQPCGSATLFFRKPVWRQLETAALAGLTSTLFTVRTRRPATGACEPMRTN